MGSVRAGHSIESMESMESMGGLTSHIANREAHYSWLDRYVTLMLLARGLCGAETLTLAPMPCLRPCA